MAHEGERVTRQRVNVRRRLESARELERRGATAGERASARAAVRRLEARLNELGGDPTYWASRGNQLRTLVVWARAVEPEEPPGVFVIPGLPASGLW